jgi:uncharacterized protein (DUF2147 family)
MSLILSVVLLLNFPLDTTQEPQIFGKWVTIDDETGEKKSVVEIYKKDQKVFGKIIQLFRGPDEDQDPLCTECPGDKKDKKIIGLEIITDMVFDDGEWTEGKILDPEDGKEYRCKLWIEDGKLMVRGYLYFFYRTQTWLAYQ